MTRRSFLIGGAASVAVASRLDGHSGTDDSCGNLGPGPGEVEGKNASKAVSDPSEVFIAKGGTPGENMKKMISAMGGIGTLVARDDIVILKPNGQWWNQGMTNTDSIGAFIEEVLRGGNFVGDILICENHHFLPDDSRGWTTDRPNGRWNLNQLVSHFRSRGQLRVAKVHWRDAGPNPHPQQGDAGNGLRVRDGAWEGNGYAWDESLQYVSPQGRKCMMTYPVFDSPCSKARIDLKSGAYDRVTGKPLRLRFINFSGINHHGSYSGVTASIKNLMGVVDMTCGYPGIEPKGYWCTHYIGAESSLYKVGETSREVLYRIGISAPSVHRPITTLGSFDFRYTGGALGYWIGHVRRPDMNFIAAEWVGWGGRTDPSKSARPRALLASKDPVALDYIAARDILLESTRLQTNDSYFIRLNNPDLEPFRGFLEECRKECGGNIRQEHIDIRRI
jgi:hypothetical protein